MQPPNSSIKFEPHHLLCVFPQPSIMLTLFGLLSSKPPTRLSTVSQELAIYRWFSRFTILWLDVYILASAMIALYGVKEFVLFQKWVFAVLMTSGLVLGGILFVYFHFNKQQPVYNMPAKVVIRRMRSWSL
jgi:hypothetical protein